MSRVLVIALACAIAVAVPTTALAQTAEPAGSPRVVPRPPPPAPPTPPAPPAASARRARARAAPVAHRAAPRTRTERRAHTPSGRRPE